MVKNLKILSANIRSLAANYDELLLLLSVPIYSESDCMYDIIALSETWISPDNLKLYPIENYKLYIANRTDGRRSGGVVYYLRESIDVISNEIVSISGANVLRLRMKCPHLDDGLESTILTIYLLYKDWSWPKEEFVNSLEREIQNEMGGRVIMIGDININLLNDDESHEYLNTMMSLGYLSLQNKPSREKSCLDHVFTNIDESLIQCRLLENKITRSFDS